MSSAASIKKDRIVASFSGRSASPDHSENDSLLDEERVSKKAIDKSDSESEEIRAGRASSTPFLQRNDNQQINSLVFNRTEPPVFNTAEEKR